MMMANMAVASWETILQRSMLIAQNACSQEEYVRMVQEKAEATLESSMKLLWSGGTAPLASLIAPFHRRATANAKRLRKK
jgi:aminoglycoside phosphotransferase family enzyme